MATIAWTKVVEPGDAGETVVVPLSGGAKYTLTVADYGGVDTAAAVRAPRTTVRPRGPVDTGRLGAGRRLGGVLLGGQVGDDDRVDSRSLGDVAVDSVRDGLRPDLQRAGRLRAGADRHQRSRVRVDRDQQRSGDDVVRRAHTGAADLTW